MPPVSSPPYPAEPTTGGPAQFLELQLGRPPEPAERALHAEILSAALEAETEPASRVPFVSLDGTPLVYSCAVGKKDAFRLLVEPGMLARDRPGQIDYALETLNTLLTIAGWRNAAPAVNAVTAAALPVDAAGAAALPGGAGLALVAGPALELRLYLDLRVDDAQTRWQRVAGALVPFGRAAAESVCTELLSRVASRALPVGLGLAIRDGGICALRLYVGVDAPELGSLLALTAARGADLDALRRLCAVLGPFESQSVTVAFDLALAGGRLQAEVGRTKVDVCRLGHPAADAVADAHRLVREFGLATEPLHVFLDQLDSCFGGSLVQYIGVGLRCGPAHVTLYAQPNGYARG